MGGKIMSQNTITLTPEQADQFGRELDAIKERVMADLGAEDADYIRRVIKVQRSLEVGGRALLFAGILPPAWLAGTAMLGIAKILDNMEIGHNIMHGQYDWMRDPAISGRTFEWDTACPARPMAALAQLHAPHPHQHRGNGPRHRLRHPADERGPAVAPLLPG
jgi:fatty acid desaturase